ncbi:prepilin-type N-terminal cleavage/methylation domain-containing protein [Pontiellaceae bacterium B12219]|nr:prepilin-type N-terminal cleavage/methylation domain-containing protein [Pontiellaceae bacterium B12219]
MRKQLPTIGKKRRGFTLIEILLALLIISVGVVSVAGLLSATIDSGSKAHDDLEVVAFAEMVLNHCQAETDWNALPISGNLTLFDYDETPVSLSLGSLQQFSMTLAGKAGSSVERGVLSYILTITASGNRKIISLQVWPGLNTTETPRVFQTECYNWNQD